MLPELPRRNRRKRPEQRAGKDIPFEPTSNGKRFTMAGGAKGPKGVKPISKWPSIVYKDRRIGERRGTRMKEITREIEDIQSRLTPVEKRQLAGVTQHAGETDELSDRVRKLLELAEERSGIIGLEAQTRRHRY